jgi:hypothetical protein
MIPTALMAAPLLAKVDAGGSALASWVPLYGLLVIFGVILAALIAFGRSGDTSSRAAAFALRTPEALERLTGVPGWAAATVGLSLYGLLVAGAGFYSDVAWHVGLGRDKDLFTAPHTSIVLGLGFIFLGGLVGVCYASLQRIESPHQLRWRAVRVPWSTVPLLALGGAALCGFPLDEMWHRTYGIDVTMWSPTHMLMILGASFSGIACWLVLADAGVRAGDSRWARGLHVVAAWLTLQGLAAPLGEFSFGVPQFQQMFHPLLLCIAAGFAMVASRLILGRGWTLGITVVNFFLMQGHLLSGGRTDGPVQTRAVGLFIASALAVEVVALVAGTRDRLRFAVASGLAIGTFGLAGEWIWNQGAYQPWRTTLLPDAVILGTIAAVAAAIVGARYARAAGLAVEDEDGSAAPKMPTPVVLIAAVVVLVCIALPMPRRVGHVTATVDVTRTVHGRADLQVSLDPPDAARSARWFQASSWQGGGLVLADLEPVSRGVYRTNRPVPVGGGWKTLVRLHRGGEMMTVPVFLPADPEIGAQEISAVHRTQRFERETHYLLRETHGGSQVLAIAISTLLSIVAVVWMAAFALATARITPRTDRPERNVRHALPVSV